MLESALPFSAKWQPNEQIERTVASEFRALAIFLRRVAPRLPLIGDVIALR